MTDPQIADALRELSRQVRWLRHAIERLLALVGLLCGAGLAVIIAKIISAFRRLRGQMRLFQIYVAIWRLRLARYCLRAGRFFADLGERLYARVWVVC